MGVATGFTGNTAAAATAVPKPHYRCLLYRLVCLAYLRLTSVAMLFPFFIALIIAFIIHFAWRQRLRRAQQTP